MFLLMLHGENQYAHSVYLVEIEHYSTFCKCFATLFISYLYGQCSDEGEPGIVCSLKRLN